MLTFQQLEVLRAVAHRGSFKRAAESLHVSVPSVVHHLETLERHFDAQLVDRLPRGSVLTPLGKFLLAEAEPLIDNVSALETAVGRYRDAGVATLRIACFPSFGANVLLPALASQGPQEIAWEILEAEPNRAIELLREEKVHVALVYDLSSAYELESYDLALDLIVEEPLEIMVGRTSEFSECDVLDLAALREAKWVLSRSTKEPSDLALIRACRKLGYEPNVPLHADDMNFFKQYVAQLGAIGPTAATSIGPNDPVVLKPTLQSLGSRRIYFVRSGQAVAPGAISWLRHAITQQLAAG